MEHRKLNLTPSQMKALYLSWGYEAYGKDTFYMSKSFGKLHRVIHVNTSKCEATSQLTSSRTNREDGKFLTKLKIPTTKKE